MNRVTTSFLTHIRMIIIKLKTLRVGKLIHQGELHMTAKIEVINI